MKPDQDLPIGLLGPAAFTIPEVLAISLKILPERVAKTLGPRGEEALNLAWVKQNL